MQHFVRCLLLTSIALSFSFSLLAQAPTVPTSNLTFSFIDGNRIRLNWSRGDGSRRMVIAKALSAVTALPVDGVDYNASSSFGDGDQVAPGEFVVYDGTGTTFLLQNLQVSTLYHFRIFEYNGSGANTQYLTASSLAGSQATVSAPTLQASNITFSNVTGNSMKLNWTRGNGAAVLVVVKAGSPVDANPVDLVLYGWNEYFGRGAQIGMGNYVVYRGGSNTITLQDLSPDVTYHVAIYEYNGSSRPIYLVPGTTASQRTETTPTVAPSNLSFAGIEGNSLRVSWTKGNGNRRLLVVREGAPVTGTPVDGTTYNANTNFGSGDQLNPGEYVMYFGTGSNIQLRNLHPSTTYFVAIFEANHSAGNTFYLTTTILTGSSSTASPPTTPASAVTFSNVGSTSMQITWTKGDGARRLLVMKAGAPVDFNPTDLTNYYFSSAFGLSTANLGNDNYGIYRSSGSTVTVTGLQPGVTYHIAIFEYNGPSAPVYLRPGTAASQSTIVVPPTVASTNLQFSGIDCDRMRLNYTRGNGTRRIIIGKANSDPTSLPVDGQDYAHSQTFGSGEELGAGEFVVYDGTSNSILISNLISGTTYFFRVYEYFGSGANTIYLTSSFGAIQQKVAGEPTSEASNFSFSNVQANRITINWTNGSGNARLLVVKVGAAVDFTPMDCTLYSASTSGTGNAAYDRGNGNYTVYRGSGNSVTLTNLNPDVNYHFALFESEGINRPVYGKAPLRGSQTTPVIAPSTQASNLIFTNLGATKLQLKWTVGSGSRRLVVLREDGVPQVDPTDANSYLANAVFGLGEVTGMNNYVVYDGTSNVVNVSGLQEGTTYLVEIYEYNGTSINIRYLRPSLSGSFTTAARPTIAPSNLMITGVTATSVQLSWTNGDGDGRILVVTPNTSFSGSLTDGVAYYSTNTYGSAAAALGNGFVCYFSSGTTATVSGLEEGSTYQFTLYEYGGPATSAAFGLTPTIGSFTTPGPPQMQASGFMASQILANSVRLDWTPGSGQGRLVVVRQGSDVNADPMDGVDYGANSGYGSGAEIGSGNFTVYSGAGSSVVVTGLQAGMAYFFSVFEYNFTGGDTRYQRTDPTVLSVVTSPLPVDCISFQGKFDASTEANILRWSTAQEENNEGFAIERSIDGLVFSRIGWMEGMGDRDELSLYEFIDHQLTASPVHYYRLGQFDFDGTQEQACQLISVANGQLAGLAWKFYPNPLIDSKLYIEGPANAWVEIELYHSTGQRLWKRKLEAGPMGIHLDLGSLAVGSYVVRLETTQGERYQQILLKK